VRRIASGFIAGGALAGVLGAVLNLIKTGIPDPVSKGDFKSIAQLIDLPSVMNVSAEGDWPQIISMMFFVGLCCYLYYDAKRAKAYRGDRGSGTASCARTPDH
jgi:hypothetical protein